MSSGSSTLATRSGFGSNAGCRNQCWSKAGGLRAESSADTAISMEAVMFMCKYYALTKTHPTNAPTVGTSTAQACQYCSLSNK